MDLPSSEGAIYRCIAILMVLYLIAAYSIRRYQTGNWSDNSNRFLLQQVFDAATFAGSVMLFLGIMSDEVLNAIGNTKPFLLIAALGGIIYSLVILIPDAKPKKKRKRATRNRSSMVLHFDPHRHRR